MSLSLNAPGSGSTPLFDADGRQIGFTSGIQAARVRRDLPWLAVAEDTDVTTETTAWLFVLRCRLVFDVLRADAAALPDLHRHYAQLASELAGLAVEGPDLEKMLANAARSGDKAGYLTVLNAACEKQPAERLLEWFSR